MAERTITKKRIESMKPGEILWDRSPPGFGVRCQVRDRVYFLKFRAKGRQRWLTIGKHGAITLEHARRKATIALAALADDRDPAAEALDAKQAMTVSQLCDQYLAAAPTMPGRHRRVKSEASLVIERGRIERHIRPLLGRLTVTEVTRVHIAKFQQQVAAGRTRADIRTRKRGRAIVRGGEGTADRTLNLVAALFRYAIRLGLRDDNPCHGVDRFGWNQSRVFLDPDQMAALGASLAEFEERHPMAVAMVRLLALTGARRGEIVGLRWSHVDRHQGVLRLPTSKTGARLVVLGAPALEMLDRLPKREGSDFVFAGDKASAPYQGVAKVWNRIREAAGLSVRLHDLRHHFASLAGELGYTLPTISALLGHRLPGTTGGYVHFTDSALRAAADRIARAVDTRLAGRHADVLVLAPKGASDRVSQT